MRAFLYFASKKPTQIGLLFATLLLPCMVCDPQVVESDSATQSIAIVQQSLGTSISKVKSGQYAPGDIDLTVQFRSPQAIPILEEQFKQNQDTVQKLKLASALVKLGDKDGIYWDYLLQQATLAVDSPVPSPWVYNIQENTGQGNSEQGVAAWAKAHNTDSATAIENATYWYPGRLMVLAELGDPRAIPLLQRALLSPSIFMEANAAKGLAQIHDEGSVRLIVDACHRAPKELAGTIAQSLVYFDDPAARKAVATYVDDASAKTMREARASGMNVFGGQAVQNLANTPK